MQSLRHAHFHDVSEMYRPALEDLAIRWRFRTRVNILVVVDTEIATQPGVGFGIGSVIELIRGAGVGCMRFNVDIALRNGQAATVEDSPGEFSPKYRGFRFNMEHEGDSVIDQYQQIWCFGFKPSNSGSNNDGEIDQPGAFPATDAELAVLAHWMNENQGGLFGTGDHHFLGASMCRRIPRLGSMRRWTNADQVPPIGTPDRIDTLRPPSNAYQPSAPGGPAALNNSPHQGDSTPQPIQWRTWQRTHWPVLWRKRPHPVLCHPTLGPIDVMPDHAHEGLCVETADISDSAFFNFDGSGNQPEYPDSTIGGPKPMPQVIADGSTLGSPPYNFDKGEQPARSAFPMISVYDGHRAGVGRVATDSTWHHWMDVNIAQLKNANNDDWKKISRYFINLAVWLNPPGYSTQCLWFSSVVSHFQYPGFEEYWRGRPIHELGDALRRHLVLQFGPCWVTERIWWDIIWVRRLWPWEILFGTDVAGRPPGIDPVLIENAYLGSLVMATLKAAEKVKADVQDGNEKVRFELDDPEAMFSQAIKESCTQVSCELSDYFEQSLEFLRKQCNGSLQGTS